MDVEDEQSGDGSETGVARVVPKRKARKVPSAIPTFRARLDAFSSSSSSHYTSTAVSVCSIFTHLLYYTLCHVYLVSTPAHRAASLRFCPTLPSRDVETLQIAPVSFPPSAVKQ